MFVSGRSARFSRSYALYARSAWGLHRVMKSMVEAQHCPGTASKNAKPVVEYGSVDCDCSLTDPGPATGLVRVNAIVPK